MGELIDLVRLARQDGFRTELSEAEVTRRVNAIQHNDADAIKYWVDGQLIVDLRDLGISGRLGPEKRPALAESCRLDQRRRGKCHRYRLSFL